MAGVDTADGSKERDMNTKKRIKELETKVAHLEDSQAVQLSIINNLRHVTELQASSLEHLRVAVELTQRTQEWPPTDQWVDDRWKSPWTYTINEGGKG